MGFAPITPTHGAHEPLKNPWIIWPLRLGLVLILPGVWLLTFADRQALAATAAQLPLGHLVLATLMILLAMCVGAIRWRLIMTALGARSRLGLLSAMRLYLVSYFYNIFIPGAVGGDILRGVLLRRRFDNAAASYLVVALERVIGLIALGCFFLIGLLAGPQFMEPRDAALALGILSALGVGVIVIARFSERIYARWRAFPPIHAPSGLVLAFAISFLSHAASIGAFAILADGLDLPIGLLDLALIVPVAFVAGVIPIAIVGVGPREVAMVALLRLFQISPERALVLSLSFALINIVIAAIGGLLQLIGRTHTDEDQATSADDTNQSSSEAPLQG